jgi:hypothetical protein
MTALQTAQESVPSLIGEGDVAPTTEEPANKEVTDTGETPSPMPPPGLTAPEQLDGTQALKSHSESRRKAAQKKAAPKFESPEIRIHDFFNN